MDEKQKKEAEEKDKKVFYRNASGRESFNMGRIFLGIMVVLTGLYFLAQNAGLIPFYLKLSWDKIWPLFLIFIGLSMIDFRGWLGVLLGILAILMLLAAILALFFMSSGGIIYFRGFY
jgi:hypothetical protein